MGTWTHKLALGCGLLLAAIVPAAAQDGATAPSKPQAQALPQAQAQYDAALAQSLGANENGMRSYVLVILKTGPTRVPDGAGRTKMFEGHFANMGRLAAEKKLVVAGPLDGVDGRRGIFVFATPDIEVAKTYVATDPVIVNGEMVAEYHQFFASAGLMAVNDIHARIQKK